MEGYLFLIAAIAILYISIWTVSRVIRFLSRVGRKQRQHDGGLTSVIDPDTKNPANKEYHKRNK